MERLTFTFILFALFRCVYGEKISTSETVHNLLKDYAKSLPASTGEQLPLEIEINLALSHVSVNDASNNFELQCFLRQYWRESRFVFDEKSGTAQLRGEQIHRIWRPDTEFLREKWTGSSSSPGDRTLLQLRHDGELRQSQLHRVTLAGDFHFEKFPFDTQRLKISVFSPSYTIDEIEFKWHEPAFLFEVEDLNGKLAPGFTVTDFTKRDCTFMTSETGIHSCLELTIIARRNYEPFIIRIFSPICTLVLVSFFSFFLDPHKFQTARVLLPAMLLIAITFFTNDLRSIIPETNYVKAIDIWLGTCVATVFAVLVQSIIVVGQSKKAELKVCGSAEPLIPKNGSNLFSNNSCSSIDYFSKVAFLLFFFIFSVSLFVLYA
ncbi:hypothetical protein PFISCL1PPCAC_16752 [Pristionchus fissidentatus]|uniref:Transmembrane ion channel n=1 Tax=Pristionchus fissidentatus TaxID=1538716 RepID=A0AAV5W528_9BILA|nr:hypothetical protein PFISCL1PPCAC_16752 [Pristionchus fissidentatus]